MLNVTVDKDKTPAIVYFQGRLDTNSAPSAEEILQAQAADCTDLIFDMQDLQYISSAGLRVLLSWHKKLNKKGGTLTIVHTDDTLDEIFDVTGFQETLNIVKNMPA